MRIKRGSIAVWIVAAVASWAPAEVCNVKVVTDASPDYHDMGSMIRSITGKWATPAEKCWAMFYWNHIARRQTAPMQLHGMELTDPIRQFNDYGYTMCSTVAGINCSIWDAMGLKTKYWDISLHTVSEVFYDGRWHIYDNSMSAIYTLCDGKTIAGVEDVGKAGSCAASGGKVEPGHVARYHCLNATSRRGFLTGADCDRSLDSEYGCFNPKGLKYRYYFYDWDRGHRYILNLREGEVYTRHYRSRGATKEYYVPNGGKDPESVNTRYRIRGNGVRTYRPSLAAAALAKTAHSAAGVVGSAAGGVQPAKAGQAGEVVFKVEGANVITSLAIKAAFERAGRDDVNAIDISTTNGLTWTRVWRNDRTGPTPVALKLVEPVNGAYEVLVKVTLLGKAAAGGARLGSIAFEAITMLNSKTQPKLLLGRNTVFVGAGEQTESIVVWPDLRGEAYKPYVVEASNVATKAEHPGYMGVLFAAKAKEDAYVVFRVDAPRDVTRVRYGGRFYNRAPRSHIDLLHSFDGGKTWRKTYSRTDTKPPWDVIHYETIDDIPAGTRSVLMKYLWNSSEAGTSACSIYAVRMEVNHKPAGAAAGPVEVTFNWSERQKDYSLVERSHTQVVAKLPCRYTIDVGGVDHPVVHSLRVNLAGAAGAVRAGYSDGKDVGGEKFVHRWVTYGRNLAEGKPYTLTVPSQDNWGAGDPEGKKLTDGVVGPPYVGGGTPRFGLAWSKGKQPEATVDLGKVEACGAFRIQIGAGWPWWDALKGEVKDVVEVLTSVDGKSYASAGRFDFDLWWKDIPINHFMPDEETAKGYTFALIPPQPVQARYVRFKITPERILTVSEVQVLDFIRFEPFDLRIALPDEKVPPAPGPPAASPAAKKPPAAPAAPAAAAQPADAQVQQGPPAMKVPKLAKAPKVDGVLDDAAWKQAAWATRFRLASGEQPKGKARLLVGQDEKCLYLAVERFEDAATLKALVARVAKHDGDEIWADDDIEIFLDPTGPRESYYQIIVNSRGTTWDAYHDSANRPDVSWEPKYRMAGKVGERSWVVELALPWSAFDRTASSRPDWAFNVMCSRRRDGENLYWSPVLNRTAHTPENFGKLVGIAHNIVNPNVAKKPAAGPAKPAETVKALFDFEDAADLKSWANLALPNPKGEPSLGDAKHPVKFELAADGATSGQRCLKLTFDGGLTPAITTTRVPIPGNWAEWGTFRADVTVGRACLVGFRVLQEKSRRGEGWDPEVSRWEFTPLLRPGKNEVAAPLHPHGWDAIKPELGKVVAIEIYMYRPRKGESISVDNLRLSTGRPPQPKAARFFVPGTGLVVGGIAELASKLKGQWQPPKDRPLDEVMAELSRRFEELRKTHPKAVMAVFRDGEKGYDPAHPEKVYAGWRDTYVNSHGPDGAIRGRMANLGKSEAVESFMRHRGELMRVDLSSIPAGSTILEARLIKIRAGGKAVEKANLFVAEPCNRPWVENEVNAYEYAKDKFWRAVGGMYYGRDGDFLPMFLAHGPASGAVNVWDFTRAVRFWTDGKHANCGFFLHGDSNYYWRAYTREAKDLRNRPALVVLYEPGRAEARAAWPQLGGPNRNSQAAETGLLKQWPPTGPKLLWKASGLGLGFSGPVVADGVIYTAGEVGEQTLVFAIGLDGKLKWKAPNGPIYPSKKRGGEVGARGTPAVDDGLVYHLGPLGRLVAFDAATGKEVWTVDYHRQFAAKEPYYGYTESVLVDGESLISYPGGRKGYMVALDKRTGNVLWANTTAHQEAGYCSPIVFECGGLRQVLTRTRTGMVAVDAGTGKLLWRGQHAGITTPIYADGKVYVNAPQKSVALKLHVRDGKVTVTEAWQSPKLDSWHEGAVLVGGYLYGCGEKSPGWTCLDFKTGKEMYRVKKPVEKGSLTCADGMLYCLGEKGTMALVKPTPEGFRVVSIFQLPKARRRSYWAYPVVCGGRLYVRHDDDLLAYDIQAPSPARGL